MPKYLIDCFSHSSDTESMVLVTELTPTAAYNKAVDYWKKDSSMIVCDPLEVLKDEDLTGLKYKEIY